jgi:hypothetical protein
MAMSFHNHRHKTSQCAHKTGQRSRDLHPSHYVPMHAHPLRIRVLSPAPPPSLPPSFPFLAAVTAAAAAAATSGSSHKYLGLINRCHFLLLHSEPHTTDKEQHVAISIPGTNLLGQRRQVHRRGRRRDSRRLPLPLSFPLAPLRRWLLLRPMLDGPGHERLQPLVCHDRAELRCRERWQWQWQWQGRERRRRRRRRRLGGVIVGGARALPGGRRGGG